MERIGSLPESRAGVGVVRRIGRCWRGKVSLRGLENRICASRKKTTRQWPSGVGLAGATDSGCLRPTNAARGTSPEDTRWWTRDVEAACLQTRVATSVECLMTMTGPSRASTVRVGKTDWPLEAQREVAVAARTSGTGTGRFEDRMGEEEVSDPGADAGAWAGAGGSRRGWASAPHG